VLRSGREQVMRDVNEPMGVSGLEMAYVVVPPTALGGDPPLKRTSALGESATTRLVRLRVGGRRQAWLTEVVGRRASVEEVVVLGSTIVLIAGFRPLALDAATGGARGGARTR
jgi:hypothetical protein